MRRFDSAVMNPTTNHSNRSEAFRLVRAAFRAVAPHWLNTAQRDFRNAVASGKLKQALRLKIDARFGKYRCSACGRRVRRFSPIDSEFQHTLRDHGWQYQSSEAETFNPENYLCPHCGATDRDRLYALYLASYLPGVSSEGTFRITDFAPSQPLSDFIRKSAAGMSCMVSYVTADLLREDVDDRVDITDMKQYADGSMEFFICSHVLEHVADDKKAISELYRILKPGGQGILVVPIILTVDEIDEDPRVTDPSERWRRFGQDDHVRLYSKAGFLSRVREAGFTVRQLGSSHFGTETFRRHAIADRSVLYIVERT